MNELLLRSVNALTLADQLLDDHMREGAHDGRAELHKLQLEHVLGQARVAAGLNPDGSFDRVPRARPPRKTFGELGKRKTADVAGAASTPRKTSAAAAGKRGRR